MYKKYQVRASARENTWKIEMKIIKKMFVKGHRYPEFY